MQPFLVDYLKILETLHREFAQALDGLSVEAVNWSPGEECNSLAVLAVHTAGAERFWIGDVVLNEPLQRDRPGEFVGRGLSAQQALGRLDAALVYAQTALDRLHMADLAATRISPRDGKEVTVAYALLHALEHTAMHAGHAQLTRQLWEAETSRK